MIKLAVFDWNGTILADVEACRGGTNQELAVLGLRAISTKEYIDTFEIPLSTFFKHHGASDKLIAAKSLEMANAFHNYYEPLAAKAKTRPGSRPLLKYLNNEDVDCVILSNHTIEGIYLQLERLKLRPLFKQVLANEDLHTSHFAGKENRLKTYLKDRRIKPSEAIIIGDTIEEVAIGKHLGLKTIAISGGYNNIGRLRKAQPDVLVSNMADIVNVIKEF